MQEQYERQSILRCSLVGYVTSQSMITIYINMYQMTLIEYSGKYIKSLHPNKSQAITYEFLFCFIMIATYISMGGKFCTRHMIEISKEFIK